MYYFLQALSIMFYFLQAYEMSCLALKEVKDTLPTKVIVDVLRSCSKVTKGELRVRGKQLHRA